MVLRRHARAFYRERHFHTAERWAQFSGHRGWSFSEYDPTLRNILDNRCLVVLGEPGAGKSTIAAAAMREGVARNWLPIFVPLLQYRGSLDAVWQGPLPIESEDLDVTRLFVLDGFDEIPPNHIDTLIAEVSTIEQRDITARFLLTSRQAVFVRRETAFSRRWPIFYISDLSDDDIDTFINNAEVDRPAFTSALTQVALHPESHNPFVLDTLLKVFRSHGALPDSRSEAIRQVIEATLASRPKKDFDRDNRALRMLGIAMETFAHNELTNEQATLVLRRSVQGLDDDSARALLDDLCHTVLLQTPTGVTFQMRSYGEYLAARELADIREPDRPLSLMYLQDRRVLSASWSNCATFLAEMHAGFRHIAARNFPDAVLSAAPSKFSASDKRAMVKGIVDTLAERRQFLVHHPIVRSDRLALFVDPVDVLWLRSQLASSDEVRVANAALVLCEVGDSDSADQIATIAFDVSRSKMLRYSALSELARIGKNDWVVKLLEKPDHEDRDIRLVRLSAAVSLMDRSQFAAVIQQVADFDSSIVELWQRFDRLESAEDVRKLLEIIRAIGEGERLSRMQGALTSLWRSAVRFWQPDFSGVLADILLQTADHHTYSNLTEALLKAVETSSLASDAIGRELAARLRQDPSKTTWLVRKAYTLIPIAEARAIRDLGEPQIVLRYLRAFGKPEVQQVLRPRSRSTTDDAEIQEFTRQEDERRATAQQHLDDVSQAESGTDIFKALARVEQTKWPDLRPAQVTALTHEAHRFFASVDLRTRIRWISPTQWETPSNLWLVLTAIDRYDLILPDDRHLVLALLAHEEDKVLRYLHRQGLSAAAIDLARSLVEDETLHDQAIYGVLRFWHNAGIIDGGANDAAAKIAVGKRDQATRELALEVVIKNNSDNTELATLAAELDGQLRERAERALLGRGHRATAERRLSALLTNPDGLKAGETDSPINNPLDWIGSITAPELWPKLASLRKVALEQSLWMVVQTITTALGKIDLLRLAQLVESQTQFAPVEWQPFQRRQAAQFHRDGTIIAAQAVPFEMVLTRMRDVTTLARFKIWVEGWHEIPVVEKFVREFQDEVAGNVVVDCFGGWGNITAPNYRPGRLWDGCHGLVVLLDGDGGRDFKRPSRPIRPTKEIKVGLERLREANVTFTILERYAFENYFPSHAFGKVLGSPPQTISETESLEKTMAGYKKEMNKAIAEHTKLSDFNGTDLGDFFDSVRERAATT